MAAVHEIFRKCQRCEKVFSAKRSQCPSCKAWQLPDGVAVGKVDPNRPDDIVFFNSQADAEIERYPTGDWDIVFGGALPPFGIVRSSATLLGGEPGAGKSTLCIHILDAICCHTGRQGLFVGAEAAAKEIIGGALRLKLKRPDLMGLMPMGSNSDFAEVVMRRKPCAVILDSLPGFVEDPADALELAGAMKGWAVQLNCPFILIDHINKGGDFAGFIKLEHKVDTTLMFTVDEVDDIRTLKPRKNRFGPTGAARSKLLGMTEGGLIVLPDDFYADGEEEEEDE